MLKIKAPTYKKVTNALIKAIQENKVDQADGVLKDDLIFFKNEEDKLLDMNVDEIMFNEKMKMLDAWIKNTGPDHKINNLFFNIVFNESRKKQELILAQLTQKCALHSDYEKLDMSLSMYEKISGPDRELKIQCLSDAFNMSILDHVYSIGVIYGKNPDEIPLSPFTLKLIENHGSLIHDSLKEKMEELMETKKTQNRKDDNFYFINSKIEVYQICIQKISECRELEQIVKPSIDNIRKNKQTV